MALNYRGAEALVTACEWHGQPAIEKHRNPRSYRHPDLEVRLVTERLRAEARLLERASEAGLPVPPLYAVDPAAATLVMAWLPGEPLERALRAPNGVAWLPQLGELLARIHAAGIVHGDPTTSNFVADGAPSKDVNGRLGVIDFGLGAASDDDECVEGVRLPFAEAVRRAEAGAILDAKTAVALLMANAALRRRAE